MKNKGKPTLKEIQDTISIDKHKLKSILAYLKEKGEVDIFYSNVGDIKYKVIA